MKNAYFAGGCFWCITPFFTRLPGVSEVVSGFSGGGEPDPSYEDVKRQKTGHRETVGIAYDPEKVSFDRLLAVFLANVDPFARRRLDELKRETGKDPQVALEPFTGFWPAGEEHQYFYLRHPEEFEKEMTASGRRKQDD